MGEGPPGYRYDDVFYLYQREGSLRSARAVVPLIRAELAPRSVLDVGCGAGAWLCAHRELGGTDHLGIDGEYVADRLLLIEKNRFRPADISRPIHLGRAFDLVQCLEVAEHLPPDHGVTLIDNLVRHSTRVLFSAAPPGQGGESHVNERAPEYWRDLFAERDYHLFDFVRPSIAGWSQVEPWYRFNVLFFAHASVVESLSPRIRGARVPDDGPIRDFSPPTQRLRRFFLRRFSSRFMSRLARLKHRYVVWKLRSSRLEP